METNKLNLFILLLHLFCGSESVPLSENSRRRNGFEFEANVEQDFNIFAYQMDRFTETLENRFDSLSEQISQLGENSLKTGEEIKAQISELKHNISSGNENLKKEIATLGLNLQKEPQQHLPGLGAGSNMGGSQTTTEVPSTTPVLSGFEKFYSSSEYFSSSIPTKELDINDTESDERTFLSEETFASIESSACQDFADNPTFVPVSQVLSRGNSGSFVVGGHDYDSSYLFICRVLYNGTYVIGKASGFGKPDECWIFDGISERSIKKDYSLLHQPEKGVELVFARNFTKNFEKPVYNSDYKLGKFYRSISGGQTQGRKTYIGRSTNSTNFQIRGDRKDVMAPGYIDPSNPEFLQVTFHGEGFLVSEYDVLMCVD